MAKFAVILPAAGRSSRFHDKSYKKPFAPLANKAVWLHSAERFLGPQRRGADDSGHCARGPRPISMFKFSANIAIPGHRSDRRRRGAGRLGRGRLARVKPQADFVCVHDAARPCLTDAWIDEIFAAAEKTGAAIFAIPVAGTLKRVGADHTIEETVSREESLGGPDAAGLPPPVAAGRLRQARRLSRPPTTPNWSSGSATR